MLAAARAAAATGPIGNGANSKVADGPPTPVGSSAKQTHNPLWTRADENAAAASRSAQLERALANARCEIMAEKERREHAQADAARTIAEVRQTHADELLRHARELSGAAEGFSQRDAEIDELRRENFASIEKAKVAAAVTEASLQQRDAVIAQVRKQIQLREDEADNQRSEAEGFRRMATKIQGGLDLAGDQIDREREKSGRTVAEFDRAAAELRRAHADDVATIEDAHAEGLAERDAQVQLARRETQAVRDELEQSRVNARRLVSEMEEAHSKEIARLGSDHLVALSKNSSEAERAIRQAKFANEETHLQHTQADETWRQHCAELQTNLRNVQADLEKEAGEVLRARADLASAEAKFKKLNADSTARITAEHTHVLSFRDREIEKIRQEIQLERRSFEQRLSDEDNLWRQHLADFEELLRSVRAELHQERENNSRSKADSERALADMQKSHGEELAKMRRVHAEKLATKDVEIERGRQDLQKEREEGEQLCSTVDDAWKARVADAEEELNRLTAQCKLDHDRLAKTKADAAASLSEAKESCRMEIERIRQTSSKSMEDEETAWEEKRRGLQSEIERLDRSEKHLQEMLKRKIQVSEEELVAARQEAGVEKERATRLKADTDRAIFSLEQKQADETDKQNAEYQANLRRHLDDAETARLEAKKAVELREEHETESQSAWRWLSRVEGDLKATQKELNHERELSASLSSAREKLVNELKHAHGEQVERLTEETVEDRSRCHAELTSIRREADEFRAEIESRQQELSAVSKQRLHDERAVEESLRARREAAVMQRRIEDRVAVSEEQWQQRVAEAAARGAAGVDLAAQRTVEKDRLETNLNILRDELEEERHEVAELRTQARASADGLGRACAVAAKAELAAESSNTSLHLMREEAWHSVAQKLEGEIAGLRAELAEEFRHGRFASR